MRIAFLADPLDKQYGGIHTYTKEIIAALSRIDKENEYLIIRASDKKEFDGFEELAVPYSAYPAYRFWRLFVELPKIIVKNKIDLVVEPAHMGPFNLPKQIKRITVIHDLTMFLFPQFHKFHSQFVQRKLLPGILKKTDHIITNSENTRKDLIQFFPFVKNKTTSILLGKDNLFQAKKEVSILSHYKIKPPYLLHTGTLEPRKNLCVLIEAFNEFKSKTGKAHQLVLVGKKGWKFKEIFAAIDRSPFKKDILLPGYVEKKDLPILYSMCDFFIYPSTYEGFGLPVLEAMACGAAVISANSSSLPEVGGTAARYFSPDSSAQLSQKMIELSKNPEMRLKSSQMGLEQAALFSWERTALETMKIFDFVYNQK